MLNFMKTRPAAEKAARLTAADAITRAEAGELTVIDVRDINEVAQSGKAAGSLHIPLMMLRFQADPRNPDFHPDLDPSKPVALYCASGARSGMAAQMLQQLGYEAVHNIGGLRDWAAAGGKIER
jgi:rhodanese-related sulfurtransferase